MSEKDQEQFQKDTLQMGHRMMYAPALSQKKMPKTGSFQKLVAPSDGAMKEEADEPAISETGG